MEAKKIEKEASKATQGNKYTVETRSTGNKSYGQLVKELILLDLSRS